MTIEGASQLRQLIEPTLKGLGYELVELVQTKTASRIVLRIDIDKPGGVSVDDCAQASRQLGAVLDVHDPIRVPYALEVSSPGAERPLTRLEHFRRFVGKKIRLSFQAAEGGLRHCRGRLQGVDEAEQVLIETSEGLVTLDRQTITQANLVAEF